MVLRFVFFVAALSANLTREEDKKSAVVEKGAHEFTN
jgi:hypothetical protein